MPQHTENFPEVKGETRDLAAGRSGFGNGRTYEQAKAIVEAAKDNPEQFGKLQADMHRTGRVSGPFRRLRVIRQAAEIRKEPPPLPGRGPYRVIVADPPWPYEIRTEDPSHRAALPYASMSIEPICAMKVASLAHEDCLLWLWTTNCDMREAFGVLDAWGFAQKTILTWAKPPLRMWRMAARANRTLLNGHARQADSRTDEPIDGVACPLRKHSQKPG